MDDFMFIPGKKSIYNAKKFLNAGNLKFSKKKYFEALENFNRCLMNSEENSKESKTALQQRLNIYKSINLSEKSEENPWDFFKLSYSSHEKLPFVIEHLRVKNDENFGRFVYTTNNLQPGDVIAIEEPFFKFLLPEARHLRCANCLKSNKMNLTPSNLCSSSMFCSDECRKIAYKIFHKREIDLRTTEFTQRILLESLDICEWNFVKLNDLMENPEMSSRTAYDFDWNDIDNFKNRIHSLLSFNALQVGPITDDLEFIETHPILDIFNNENERKIAKNFMKRASRILSVNCYSLDWLLPDSDEGNCLLKNSNKMKVGSGLFIFGSLFNHSCAPNIERILVDNKFVFYVRRPIHEGEQLFISYGPSFTREPNEYRQMNLQNSFHFACSCEACSSNYPITFNPSLQSLRLVIKEETSPTMEKWIEEFKKNCDFIKENCQKFPNRMICTLMDRNLYLLAAIAKNEPFIF